MPSKHFDETLCKVFKHCGQACRQAILCHSIERFDLLRCAPLVSGGRLAEPRKKAGNVIKMHEIMCFSENGLIQLRVERKGEIALLPSCVINGHNVLLLLESSGGRKKHAEWLKTICKKSQKKLLSVHKTFQSSVRFKLSHQEMRLFWQFLTYSILELLSSAECKVEIVEEKKEVILLCRKEKEQYKKTVS